MTVLLQLDVCCWARSSNVNDLLKRDEKLSFSISICSFHFGNINFNINFENISYQYQSRYQYLEKQSAITVSISISKIRICNTNINFNIWDKIPQFRFQSQQSFYDFCNTNFPSISILHRYCNFNLNIFLNLNIIAHPCYVRPKTA